MTDRRDGEPLANGRLAGRTAGRREEQGERSARRLLEEPAEAGLLGLLFLRKLLASLLLFVFVFGGVVAYHGMIKEGDPDLEIPKAHIVTEWPGADPEQIEKEITNKIETEIKSVRNLKRTASGSQDNLSMIAVEFEASASLQPSMALLRAKVDQAKAELPTDESRKAPRIDEVTVSDQPIVTVILYDAYAADRTAPARKAPSPEPATAEGTAGVATTGVTGVTGDAPAVDAPAAGAAPIDPAILARAAKRLEEILERLPGVREVNVIGSRDEEVQIRLDPLRLASLSLSATAVRDAIRAANRDLPWGEFENEALPFHLRYRGRFRDVETLEGVPVRRRDEGGLIRLRDVATIRRDLEKETTRAFHGGGGWPFVPCVVLEVKKSPGRDTIATVAAAKAAVEAAKGRDDWPIRLATTFTADESELIVAELRGMANNGLQAMGIVFLVLMILLSWREALIAGLAIPVTFLGALAILGALGYTLNNMVIIGMVLALGLLVDDFILVMEGMHEALAEGKPMGAAKIWTLRTYAMASLSGSLTTILAFLPMAFMGGVAGKFIRIIPVTTSICLTLSYFVSLFLCIPLCDLLLRAFPKRATGTGHGTDGKCTHGAGADGAGAGGSYADRVTAWIGARVAAWLLRWTVGSWGKACGWLVAALGLFLLSGVLVSLQPFTLYPKDDGRKMGLTIELTPDATLEDAQRVADIAGAHLRDLPYLESVTQYVGAKGPYAGGGTNGSILPAEGDYLVGFGCVFTPEEERDAPAFVHAEALRATFDEAVANAIPGAKVRVWVDTGGAGNDAPIQVVIEGPRMSVLRDLSRQVQAKLRAIPGAADVRDTLGPTRLEVICKPKREAADFYGLREDDLADQVRLTLADDKIGEFLRPGTAENLDLRLGMAWPSRGGRLGGPRAWRELELASVISDRRRRVPAQALLETTVDEAALTITHRDGARAVTVEAETQGRTAASILADLMPEVDRLRASPLWPRGYRVYVAGEAEETVETFGSSAVALGAAFFLVFGILALLFGNYRQPFIIMFSVPFALSGAFLGFFYANMDLSFPAMVGMISLIGIAVNDAIVLVETMNARHREGLPVARAAAAGAADRLRPILSTTLTTIVGLLPLALSDKLWEPLCFAIIFGLLMATFVSVLVIPCLFLLLTPRLAHDRPAGPAATSEPAAACASTGAAGLGGADSAAGSAKPPETHTSPPPASSPPALPPQGPATPWGI